MKKLFLIATALILSTAAKSQHVNQDKFPTFDCQYIGGRVNIIWSATYDADDGVFFVERSDNGTNFERIGYKASVLPFSGQNYTFMDMDPLPGYSYYRIFSYGNNVYSEVKTVFNNYSVIGDLGKTSEKESNKMLN